jgi:hypothetical protein
VSCDRRDTGSQRADQLFSRCPIAPGTRTIITHQNQSVRSMAPRSSPARSAYGVMMTADVAITPAMSSKGDRCWRARFTAR